MMSLGMVASSVVDGLTTFEDGLYITNPRIIKLTSSAFLLIYDYGPTGPQYTKCRKVEIIDGVLSVGEAHAIYSASTVAVCQINETTVVALTYGNAGSLSVYKINTDTFTVISGNIGTGISIMSSEIVKLSNDSIAVFYIDNSSSIKHRLRIVTINGSVSIGDALDLTGVSVGDIGLVALAENLLMIAYNFYSSSSYITCRVYSVSGLTLTYKMFGTVFSVYSDCYYIKLLKISNNKVAIIYGYYSSSNSVSVRHITFDLNFDPYITCYISSSLNYLTEFYANSLVKVIEDNLKVIVPNTVSADYLEINSSGNSPLIAHSTPLNGLNMELKDFDFFSESYAITGIDSLGRGLLNLIPIQIVSYPLPGLPAGKAFGDEYEGGYLGGVINIDGRYYYLIIAPNTGGRHASTWGPLGLTTAISTYDGQKNSNALNSPSYPAAYWANNLELNGFSDWYLPSKNELEIIYFNLKPNSSPSNLSSGINLNAVPPREFSYSVTNPEQTIAELFKEGGSESFTDGWVYTSTDLTSNECSLSLLGGTSSGYQSSGSQGYPKNSYPTFISIAIRKILIS